MVVDFKSREGPETGIVGLAERDDDDSENSELVLNMGSTELTEVPSQTEMTDLNEPLSQTELTELTELRPNIMVGGN